MRCSPAMLSDAHAKSLRPMPQSFSAPRTDVLIGQHAHLLHKIRPQPVKFSRAVVPAFFELGGGGPRRARTARTSMLERAATTPPIPVDEPNTSRPTSLTFCGCARDSAVNLSTAFEGGEFKPSENARPQLYSVAVVLLRAISLHICGTEVAGPRGAARRRLRRCRDVRTIDACYVSWGGVAPLERGR